MTNTTPLITLAGIELLDLLPHLYGEVWAPRIVLDEYQDTGVAQRTLLAELFGVEHAVTAVGDPNQAIYGWRGASVGNLLRFREHFGGDGPALPLMWL